MIRKTIILWAAALCLIAGGCSYEKAVGLPDGGDTQSASAVGFRVSEDGFSRAQTVDYSKLTGIGVYGYHTGTERWSWASANTPAALEPNYFCNTPLNKSEGWSYSPLKYWPVDPIYKLSFFAYAPYVATRDGDNPIDLSGAMLEPYPATDDQSGVPTLRYTVPEDIESQIDLLWAARHDMTGADAPVTFDMKHALTKIHFTAQFANLEESTKGYSVSVKKITIAGVHGGGTLDLGSGAWSFPGGTPDASYVIEGTQLGSGQDVTTGYFDVKNWLSLPVGSLMLIPQDLADATLTYDLLFDNGQGDKFDISMPFRLADMEPWAGGKAIDYRLMITAEFIRIRTALVRWQSGPNTSVTQDL